MMFKAPQDPRELRSWNVQELETLAQEIRQAILTTCLKNGGHLGASLGTVEIAIALHSVFDSPAEPIVWDVGHQAYAHKLLTGRWDRFSTLRQEGGISGFLSREENEHDVFGAGHSSTALSAALAMAWARRGTDRWTVAVVGDGGLTAGIAFEALNSFREALPGPFLLMLNDNQMSISPNSGAIPTILASPQTAREYFSHFGFDYVGPIDGHDLSGLLSVLKGIKQAGTGRPVVVHTLTQKGKGYPPAEALPAAFHGVNPLQEKTPGQAAKPKAQSYSEVFGDAIVHLAEKDSRIVAITAAMKEGTGLGPFASRFRERFFDVGIAEPHAVTFAAGLATQGQHPVVCIYSTFLQRGLDSVIHDAALQNLGVTWVVDRAGVVGADGPTHHGAFDLVYLGMIPNLHLSAPACLEDVSELLERATRSGKPWAIRFPRGSGPRALDAPLEGSLRWHHRANSPKLIVVALGTIAVRAEAAFKKSGNITDVTLVSTVDAKPIPRELIEYLKKNSSAALLTLEDGVIRGGFGQALLSELSGRTGGWEIAGYEDRFLPHASPAALEESQGLSEAGILNRIQKLLSSS